MDVSSRLLRHTQIVDIIGDLVRVQAPGVALGETALVHNVDGESSVGVVVELDGELASLQVFGGGMGISSDARVRFLGHAMRVTCSQNILGRTFRGTGEPIDGGPDLTGEPQVELSGPTVNPVMRSLPTRMIETEVPMIDLFNCLVESQKIPIFSTAGEPYNALLARIGFQADADVVVFGGMGLIFDDLHFFRSAFEERGVSHRTVMFVNQASDPISERILIPDMALAVAEKLAVEENKRVLVLLTDMTAFADALKELGISREQIPALRGYMGDLYTQLARRYEKACDFKGAGSVTILTVTTMPGGDVTHPVPDNTGYITEGQFYLHDKMIDPFGSLSRLKQRVIGKVTRKDHMQLMNTMIRLYSEAREAEKKQAMAFELSAFDEKLLRFGELFRERFMDIDVSLPLTDALDLCWRTLADCFEPRELLMKQQLVDEYFPRRAEAPAPAAG
ncbi:MAG: V-type ATP synthase subunit B [Myxococcales bacterium]|nr:V-type ATP synthase subunit B [Myxococcales bacterium]MCB9718370.1 V-type ATP synthase subunit B [Myxococcales bacterium]